MPSIVNEYFLRKDKTAEYLILAVALFLIIGVWTIILFFTTRYNSSDVRAYETCAASLCPTNRLTGTKRCPENDALPLQYDPIFEVCNPKDACTNDSTPYAVQADGATSLTGVCDVPGCRCINQFQTPGYTQVIFNRSGGDVQSILNGLTSSIIYVQQPTPYTGEGNIVALPYKDPTNQFYQISASELAYLSGSPCATLFQGTPELKNADYFECINLNPCVVGRMAFVPANVSAYNNIDVTDASGLLNGTPLACVPNTVENTPDSNFPNSCYTNTPGTSYYAPVFNTLNGKINCIATSTPIGP